MQPLSLTLRVIALIGASLAGVAWFLTNGKLDDIQQQLRSARASASSFQSQLAEAQQRIEEQEVSIKELQGDLADAKRRTTRAQTDFNEARQELAQVRNQLQDVRQKRDTLQQDNENLRQEILNATTGPTTAKGLASEDRKAYENQISELKRQISDLSEELADAQAALVDARDTVPASSGTTVSAGTASRSSGGDPSGGSLGASGTIQATIASLDRKLGLLVVDVGSNNGLTSSGEYTLEQSGYTVGRARVQTLQSSMAVLALLPDIGTPDALRKGDRVLLAL
ncbi:MAG: hypothetical protein ACFE0O_03830 [Opitutales bacterium]